MYGTYLCHVGEALSRAPRYGLQQKKTGFCYQAHRVILEGTSRARSGGHMCGGGLSLASGPRQLADWLKVAHPWHLPGPGAPGSCRPALIAHSCPQPRRGAAAAGTGPQRHAGRRPPGRGHLHRSRGGVCRQSPPTGKCRQRRQVWATCPPGD